MSNTTIVAIALAAAVALGSGPAFARQCPRDMAEIDAALANNPQVSQEALAEVRRLRAEGEQAHQAGRHPESEAALAKAKTLLGLQG